MNIYLVNKKSKIKGPYDITDQNRRHVIRIGDVCIRDTIDGLQFLLVISLQNKWSSCKCISIVNNEEFEEGGNTLLFSFNGVDGRKGNIEKLGILKRFFTQSPITQFLNNATDILEYKKDLWDSEIFKDLFGSIHEVVKQKSLINPVKEVKVSDHPILFVAYLEKKVQDEFYYLIESGSSIKSAFTEIRNKFPKEFRYAMLDFINEHPHKSIYDKI